MKKHLENAYKLIFLLAGFAGNACMTAVVLLFGLLLTALCLVICAAIIAAPFFAIYLVVKSILF